MTRRLRPAGHVYAFEPVPANRARLEQAVAANALDNVSVSPFAMGDGSRHVDMWLRSSQTGAGTGTAAVVPTGTGHLTVSMKRLDEWCVELGLPRLDFIKLDVEGAEFIVLEGAEQVLARHRPLILAEIDAYWISTHERTAEDVVRWASAHDYRMLSWDRRRRRFRLSDWPGDQETLLVPGERA